MKIIVRNIRLPISQTEREAMEQAAGRLAPLIDKKDIKGKCIFRRSLDVRHKKLTFVYSVAIETDACIDVSSLEKYDSVQLNEADPLEAISRGDEVSENRPVIVGFGPCGMFCALVLAEQGYRPIVLERGENVLSRAQKVGVFIREGILDTESNIQFGAGGAGTFSDGKLVTRINDLRTGYVLKRLYEFGAPKQIMLNAKPHIGTDKLLSVVSAIDLRIRELGGEVRYGTKVTGIKTDASGKAYAVMTEQGDVPCSQLVLAIGHSARDTYSLLLDSGFNMAAKPFSVGVRIEHLREDIERAMFGDEAGNPVLPSAEYALSKRVQDDCVYTFCMCPGGEVVAAASEQGGVVTNGMSRFKRDGRNSNAALVVSVMPEGDPIEFQRRLENKAFVIGGSDYKAPIQTVQGFLSGRSGSSPKKVMPTYRRGQVKEADISKLFPQKINNMLKLGLRDFDRKIKGFADPQAVLTGVESRTSAPYRILRGEGMNAIGYDNIYPCGEGAGYAGGITSAAVDGVKAAEQIIKRFSPSKD